MANIDGERNRNILPSGKTIRYTKSIVERRRLEANKQVDPSDDFYTPPDDASENQIRIWELSFLAEFRSPRLSRRDSAIIVGIRISQRNTIALRDMVDRSVFRGENSLDSDLEASR